MQDCDEAIAHDAKEFAAWFNKGNAQARLEDYAEALKSYRQAADLAPGIAGYRWAGSGSLRHILLPVLSQTLHTV